MHLPTALALSLGGLVLSLAPAGATAPAPSTSPDADRPAPTTARRGSLSTSPSTYVGGQAITFTGSLGVRGRRRITLQQHMNRPGDSWFAVRGFSGRTAKDGSFSFRFPAPAMFGIRYRVVAKGRTTPPVTFNAKQQDLTMWVSGEDPSAERDPGQPVAGRPFSVSVDTTPDLFRRPETRGLPVFDGRPLRLERRVDGDTWETLARSSVGADGMGYFHGLVEPAGTVVYRVVEEEIVSGADEIGWMQSFPTYLTVLDPSAAATVRIAHRPTATVSRPAARRTAGRASATASSRYHWYPSTYDFSWESGQSLTSRPDAGTKRRGWWQDYADGAGRVARQNGGLYLDSKRDNAGGPGDFGTTRATLHGNASRYGRWEVRLRLKTAEAGEEDFDVRVELVPERAKDYACGRRNITLAEVRAHSGTMSFGARHDTVRWTGSRRIASLVHSSPAVAVEVGKKHLTWFWDGKPIGTVKGKRAVPGVPMTLRFSMVGDQAGEYNQTGVISDWQRGFGIKAGKQVKKGPKLKRSALTGCES